MLFGQKSARRLLFTAFVAALVCIPALPAGAQAKKEVVRLGHIRSNIITAPIYIGMDRGYFDEENIEVVLTPVQGGSDSIIQLSAGNFDVAATGAGAGLLNAANQGLRFKIVAPLHTERPPVATPLIIAPDRVSEIKSVKDLKGKKIGINATGAAIEYWVYSAITRAGLKLEDITFVTVPFPSMPAALQSRAIDAAVLTEPQATIGKDKGIVAILADDFIDGITVTYVFMGEPLLKDRPKVAEGFIRAYMRAVRALQGDAWKKKETAASIEKYAEVPADVILRMNRPYFDPNCEIPMNDLDTLQKYFLMRGTLEYKQPLDLTKFVDTSLVEKALKDLGRYPIPTPAATMAATAAK